MWLPYGLHVDTGHVGKGLAHCSREDRVSLVCMSVSIEDEHHFLFDCLAYNNIRQQYSNLLHQSSLSPSSVAFFQPLTSSTC